MRSISASKDSNNNVEIGWRKTEDQSYDEVSTYEINRGIKHETITPIRPDPGTFHKYWVVNANGNDSWAFNYDNIYISSAYVPNMVQVGMALTNSEKHHGPDSLRAHFTHSQICTELGCAAYHDPSNSSLVEDNTAGQWYWCKIDNTESHVEEVC